VGKRYKGKHCVYCGTAGSDTKDHIVAREFFLVNRRDGLPKAPACSRCNNAKSKLEHYLLSVLPFGGEHLDLVEILQSSVSKRLAKNLPLHRALSEGRGTTWTRTSSGLHVQTITLPVNTTALKELFAMIARGLIWHHWRTYLTKADFIDIEFLTMVGERFFRERFFGLNARNRVSNSLGAGAFLYEGVQSVDSPQLTVWLMSLYGGIRLGGDDRAPEETASLVGVITGPKSARRTKSSSNPR
jgi:hypothetical protein